MEWSGGSWSRCGATARSRGTPQRSLARTAPSSDSGRAYSQGLLGVCGPCPVAAWLRRLPAEGRSRTKEWRTTPERSPEDERKEAHMDTRSRGAGCSTYSSPPLILALAPRLLPYCPAATSPHPASCYQAAHTAFLPHTSLSLALVYHHGHWTRGSEGEKAVAAAVGGNRSLWPTSSVRDCCCPLPGITPVGAGCAGCSK